METFPYVEAIDDWKAVDTYVDYIYEKPTLVTKIVCNVACVFYKSIVCFKCCLLA